MAVVGLEETFYQISETDGVVVVCVVIYEPDIICLIEFPFDVSLSTTVGFAGKTNNFIFHMDYLNPCGLKRFTHFTSFSHGL